MKIGIYLDKFSGHLFHDIELFIVAFEKIINNFEMKSIEIYFIKRENNKFMNAITKNKLLLKRLFNQDNINIINNIKEQKFDLIIDRYKLDHKNINKAFATSIKNFPTNIWAEKISDLEQTKTILYATRQNTRRRLNNISHNLISRIVKINKGTICDLGKLSLENQIKLFRQHKIVIGVHGNNLSGIMWMKPDSYVFEIIPPKEKPKVYDYHCMSLCMKHNYNQVSCSGSLNSDMYISPKNIIILSKLVKMYLSKKI